MPETTAELTDFLNVCNDHNIPWQDFEQQFCSRCFQKCTRSQPSRSKFGHRANNWYSELFAEVPRMDQKDPRFQEISGKRFLPIMPTSPAAQSAWIDPRNEGPVQVQVPVQLAAPEPEPLELVPVTPEPPKVEAPPPPPMVIPASAGEIRNTPALPRQMIGGAQPKPVAPVLDPWQPNSPPPQLRPGERQVKPGARIKFGGK
jgi:hypothetical protein